ncbi:hypothetical protein VTP01DRAFT_2519 [Rhizomucor pusillus]|uniref:uncharacterized protein n=1 Tax=Rhizomucor pusillus TaxID=4840 RepID=UPI003742F3A8
MSSSSRSKSIDSSQMQDASDRTPLLSKATSSRSSSRQASHWYALPPIFAVGFAMGAIYAPQIQFYTEIFCYRYYQRINNESDNNASTLVDDGLAPIQDCAVPEVQEIVATAQAAIQFLLYGSTLIAAGHYGFMSDIKGRVPVIQISLLGMVVFIACNIATAKLQDYVGVFPLFLAPLLRGLLAGDIVLMAAIQAYVSDCTLPRDRTTSFGYIIAATLLGTALGSMTGGIIVKGTGSVLNVFYAALVSSLVIVGYSFCIPESNKHLASVNAGESSPTLLERINIFSALRLLFHVKQTHANRYALPAAANTVFLITLIMMPPLMLYAMLVWGWTAYEGSMLVGIVSIARLLTMTLVLPLLSRFFLNGTNSQHKLLNFNLWLARVGTLIETMEMILFGLAANTAQALLVAILGSFGILPQPALRAIVTTLVDPKDVGKVLGAVAVTETVAMIVSQLVMNSLYGWSVAFMPNLTFFVCAVVGFSAFLSTFLIWERKDSWSDSAAAQEEASSSSSTAAHQD